MLTMEYDYATDIAAQKEESFEEGREEGREKERFASIRNIMESLNISLDKALDVLKIQPEERSKFAAMLS